MPLWGEAVALWVEALPSTRRAPSPDVERQTHNILDVVFEPNG